jgi:hypothetical protein
MASKNDTTKRPRSKGSQPARTLESIKQDRFIEEQLKLDGSESPYFRENGQCLVPRRPIHCIEELMWMKQNCSPEKPCSPRRTCGLHLEHVQLWSNPDFRLSAMENGGSRRRYCDVQSDTRKTYFKKTERMSGIVGRCPEEWPAESAWEASRIELRDAVNRVIGMDPGRAAALSALLRILRATHNTPVNFQYKLATMAIDTTWTLQGLFEKAVALGVSIEELHQASPWEGR